MNKSNSDYVKGTPNFNYSTTQNGSLSNVFITSPKRKNSDSSVGINDERTYLNNIIEEI